MNSIVMMNVARLDVFCQVGFLGSNIGHSGHFALVRKIGPATAGGEEERKARCSKSRWASFHHDDLGFNYGHLEAISSVFLQKPKQLFILLSLLPFLWHQSFFLLLLEINLDHLEYLGLVCMLNCVVKNSDKLYNFTSDPYLVFSCVYHRIWLFLPCNWHFPLQSLVLPYKLTFSTWKYRRLTMKSRISFVRPFN